MALISCHNKKTTVVSKAVFSGEYKIDSNTVKKHIYTLASDDMEGRANGTQGIEKAAVYIEKEFRRIGLTTFKDLETYRQTFTFKNRNTEKEITASNIIGVLEGKSNKNEFVIFSAHYDHLGILKKAEQVDSIYNGANDDASGVTGVLALAEYFKKKNFNQRTLGFYCLCRGGNGVNGLFTFW